MKCEKYIMFILDAEDSAFLVSQSSVHHLDDAIEIVGKWTKMSTYIIYFFSYSNFQFIYVYTYS